MEPTARDHLLAQFERDGYVVVGDLFDAGTLDQLQSEMEGLQRAASRGELGPEHTGTMFLAPFEGEQPPYVHYVNAVTTVSPAADAAFHHPVIVDLLTTMLGADMYFWDYNGHGAIYQDARPGEGMTYTRIGWHSDHQSRPTSDIWPGVAVTVHLDPTSPANGFLRVVAGESPTLRRRHASGIREGSRGGRRLRRTGRCDAPSQRPVAQRRPSDRRSPAGRAPAPPGHIPRRSTARGRRAPRAVQQKRSPLTLATTRSGPPPNGSVRTAA